MQRLVSVHRVGIDGIGIENSLSNVAEDLMDSVRERMRRRRLMIPDNHDTGTFSFRQISSHDTHEPLIFRTDRRMGKTGASDDAAGLMVVDGIHQGIRNPLDIPCPYRQPMIRL